MLSEEDKQVAARRLDLAEALSSNAELYGRLGMSDRAAPLLRRSYKILR